MLFDDLVLTFLFGFIFMLIMAAYGSGLFALVTLFNSHSHFWSIILIIFIVLTFAAGVTLFTLLVIRINNNK
jgi:hypothetical protein